MLVCVGILPEIVFARQKTMMLMIATFNVAGKPMITVTQMLLV